MKWGGKVVILDCKYIPQPFTNPLLQYLCYFITLVSPSDTIYLSRLNRIHKFFVVSNLENFSGAAVELVLGALLS